MRTQILLDRRWGPSGQLPGLLSKPVKQPDTFHQYASSLRMRLIWGNCLLRVCETRCPKCGRAVREERAHYRCEGCGIVEACCEGPHDGLASDLAVVETRRDLIEFDQKPLPSTG